jgi:hypothetical protein
VNDPLEPFEDQGGYLATISRMEPGTVETVVRALERHGKVVGVRMSLIDENAVAEPWLLPPGLCRCLELRPDTLKKSYE